MRIAGRKRARFARLVACRASIRHELLSQAGDENARTRLTRGGAPAVVTAMEVLGGEDTLPGMATRLELFRAAEGGTPPVGSGMDSLTTWWRRIGDVIERQHDA
jgi:hypothetical protein